jgi:hypothetical protein
MAVMRVCRYALAIVVSLGLTACSTEAPPPRTAATIVKTIAAKVASARPGFVYTADTDPNHLLGKPNGYTSEATFTDNRISPADAAGVRPGSVQKGGLVEVFLDASSATIRQQRLGQLEKNAPLLYSEYTFTDGPALLRVSGRLTPAQAAEYAAAFRS